MLLKYAGYFKIDNIHTRVYALYPDWVLQESWSESLHLPPCQYSENIAKERDHCYLFLAVMVRPIGFDRRDTIRKTWYGNLTKKSPLTQLRFFVGTSGLSKEMLSMLQREQALYHDIAMLDQLLDSYKNLTRKTIQAMKWSAQHVNFTYYFKLDDDTYPVLNNIISQLQERKQIGRFYWGNFFVNLEARHSGKNGDKDWFLTTQYTPFATGGAYILSSDMVHLIAGLENGLQYYANEDVSVGLWLAPYQIERKHEYRFCRRQICSHNTLVFIDRSKEQFLSIAKFFQL